jgi:glycerophosphoryl diester phosphodiesterase
LRRDSERTLGRFLLQLRYLTQAVDEIRNAGYWLLCYTVDDPDGARRLFSWGVDAIFTDRLDLIGPDFA